MAKKKKFPAAATLDRRLEALRGRSQEELASLLAELASTHPEVEERLARHALAADPAGSPSDFEAWRESLPPGERASAAEIARERAAIHDDPIAGTQVLLALQDDAAAEALLLAQHATIQGGDYGRLVPLAEALEKKGRLLGSIACYRALLLDILARAHSRAYRHAAEYLQVLRRLDSRVDDYGPLLAHAAFESMLRSMHGRKVSFWSRIRA